MDEEKYWGLLLDPECKPEFIVCQGPWVSLTVFPPIQPFFVEENTPVDLNFRERVLPLRKFLLNDQYSYRHYIWKVWAEESLSEIAAAHMIREVLAEAFCKTFGLQWEDEKRLGNDPLTRWKVWKALS